MKAFLALLLIVLSLFGIMDAGYLTYEKLSGAIPKCGPGFDCGKVLSSQWSSIGPIPLSAFGLVFYFTVFFISILYYLEIDVIAAIRKILPVPQPLSHLTTQKVLFSISVFGFFFSLYLIFLMKFIIQAWCLYCLVSAGISSSLFLVNLVLQFVETKGNKNHEHTDH